MFMLHLFNYNFKNNINNNLRTVSNLLTWPRPSRLQITCNVGGTWSIGTAQLLMLLTELEITYIFSGGGSGPVAAVVTGWWW